MLMPIDPTRPTHNISIASMAVAESLATGIQAIAALQQIGEGADVSVRPAPSHLSKP